MHGTGIRWVTLSVAALATIACGSSGKNDAGPSGSSAGQGADASAASGGSGETGSSGSTGAGSGGSAVAGSSGSTGGAGAGSSGGMGAMDGSAGALSGSSTAGAGGASASGSAGESNGKDGGADGSGVWSNRYYVSPTGSGTVCSAASPCSITQAQTAVRAAASAASSDVVVELADGTYSVAAPLVFTDADSLAGGHTVSWQGATNAHPLLSGGIPITGWTLGDAGKNIWKASAPSAFATRELYVAGKAATRARSSSIDRTDMSFTANGWTFTNSSLSYLNNLAQPQRAELDVIGSWTNRYSPIQAVADNTVTMTQPAWAENTWGYDTVQSPYRQGPIYAENDYTLLDQPGEWYQDTTAGALYYIPLTGQDMTTVDVELPQLQWLLAVGGTYDKPAHDISFSGLTFSYTSWLGPNSTDGFVDQQTGGFAVGPRSLYPAFEATRPVWHQMPAAVQVSAAANISFLGDRFVDLGSVGLGIGNDADAHESGVGLGASGIQVIGGVFSQIAASGIAIGGFQATAHHPGGDVPLSALTPTELAMIDENITISDNLIHDIGIDYRDSVAILFTYTQQVVVSHNETYNLPYSGIASGFGWGTNDAGGNGDYKTRANGDLYMYQPLYTNPTVAENNTVSANYVHNAMLQMNDGGCHYNLSANPGTVVKGNYCNASGSGLSGLFIGDYEDEGSAYLTITSNVFASFGEWVFANANAANDTGHLTWTNNWVSGSPSIQGPSEVNTGNVTISGSQISGFPANAQTVANAAGLEAAYAGLKSNP
jgi:hypothetical protein